MHKEWILVNFGCSFHMTPNKDWFKTYNQVDGGTVLLGNNKACKVIGIGFVRLRMFDGMDRVLQRNLKKLRIDNGLEFCGDKFSKFSRENGVAWHKTVRDTPQQNELAERFNRTILERVRCMLNHVRLLKSFWAEAVSSAVYCINRFPSTTLEFKTPQEVWSGRKANYSKLKVFGCIAYAHTKQDKLEPRALKCIFIGYPEGVKGYKLWCLKPGYKKCLISRDVIFNEIEMANLVKPSKVEIHEKSQDQTIKIKVEFVVTTEGETTTQR
uniref:Retrovirus-related Pol polyprotein from transposon TNT 1-94 n=1 Tax=Cajanus cajan TaxID=3821 RepID=A0A151RYW8_CAJCA|nr:Retrovirus-related Pol polyprotein from transposon TNT 1-94 [Cajanus cajan]